MTYKIRIVFEDMYFYKVADIKPVDYTPIVNNKLHTPVFENWKEFKNWFHDKYRGYKRSGLVINTHGQAVPEIIMATFYLKNVCKSPVDIAQDYLDFIKKDVLQHVEKSNFF
jgi:hypothetical protein